MLSPTFHSFSKVSDTATGSQQPPEPDRHAASRRSVQPAAISSALRTNAAARMQALRAGAATFSSGINASVVPSALLGTTWVWNPTTHKYEQDGTFTPAAPTDRVRIILYAVDPITDQIVENPLTSTGFVDLVDESTTSPAVDKLHVIVSGGTPTSPAPCTSITRSVARSPATGDGVHCDGRRLCKRRHAHPHVQRHVCGNAAQHEQSGRPNRYHVGPGHP